MGRLPPASLTSTARKRASPGPTLAECAPAPAGDRGQVDFARGIGGAASRSLMSGFFGCCRCRGSRLPGWAAGGTGGVEDDSGLRPAGRAVGCYQAGRGRQRFADRGSAVARRLGRPRGRLRRRDHRLGRCFAVSAGDPGSGILAAGLIVASWGSERARAAMPPVGGGTIFDFGAGSLRIQFERANSLDPGVVRWATGCARRRWIRRTDPGADDARGRCDPRRLRPRRRLGRSNHRCCRLKTRLETRPKKPHGLNSPVPLPQWLKGPD